MRATVLACLGIALASWGAPGCRAGGNLPDPGLAEAFPDPGEIDPGPVPTDLPADLREVPGDPGIPGADAGPDAPDAPVDAGGGPDTPDAGVEPHPVAWKKLPGSPNVTAVALWVNADDDGWVAARAKAGVVHWDGNDWTHMDGPGGKGSGASTIWSAGPGNVWADGFRWDGTAWVDGFLEEARAEGLKALWGSGPTDLWALPGGPRLGRWDGSKWSTVMPVLDESAHWTTIGGTGPDDVWIAGMAGGGWLGQMGRALHWDGQEWQDRSAGLGWPVHRIHAAAGTAWMCTREGPFARWEGTWIPHDQPLPQCMGLWGSGPTDLWMVDGAREDLVARGGPGGWVRHLTALPVRFWAVGGTATVTWLATLGGDVYRLDRTGCGDPAAEPDCCALGFGRCRFDACGFEAVVAEVCPEGCPGCPLLCLPNFTQDCCDCTPGCTLAECEATTGRCRFARSCWKDACGNPGATLDECEGREVCRNEPYTPLGCDEWRCVPECAGPCGVPDGCGGTCECPSPWEACCDGRCSNNPCCGRCAADETCVLGRCCKADCGGRTCGGDGCGGMCGLCPVGQECCNDRCTAEPCCGRCGPDEICTPAGTCCRPDCPATLPPTCGDDGCGGLCRECPDGQQCCADRACHPDDCCGGCPAGEACVVDPGSHRGFKVCCRPDCDGRACGDDGCGGSCGTCPAGSGCTGAGTCSPDPCAGACNPLQVCTGRGCCTPDCRGDRCGDDGCGGDCGGCPDGTACFQHRCCSPDCAGRACGPDGCGGWCGGCGPGQLCCDGECADDACCGECGEGEVCLAERGTCCRPACGEHECGDDGCGGTCGTCGPGETCDGNPGACCVPACAWKTCGDDGCGGSCGTCPADQWCCGSQCSTQPCCGCGDGRVCNGVDCVPPTCGVAVCGWSQGLACGACEPGVACVDGRCCPADCTFRECGDDGCGGSCGTCPPGRACSPGGLCVDPCSLCAADQVCFGGQHCCTRQCDGRACGGDGCGGSCGACPDGGFCSEAKGQCLPDACGGKCSGGKRCVAGICTCVPDQSTTCGPYGGAWWVDSCGAIGDASGDCLLGCLDGRCLGCTPDCTGKPCGDDGCGGSCGACADGERCFDPPGGTAVCRVGRGLDCCGDRLCKKVVDPFTRKPWTSLYDPCAQGCWKGWCLGCTWDCFDRSCGDDGCGGSCGTCPSPTTCSGAGRCGT